LSIDGNAVEPAIIDTGGGYELMLRDAYDLRLVDVTEVVAFGGREVVGVTEGFPYSVGGWSTQADAAIVGLSVCDCNGIGFHFFRKTGAVLSVDYGSATAAFLASAPTGGVEIAFSDPPESLPTFDGAFVEVDVESGGEYRDVLALLDTGANTSVMRRGLVGESSVLQGGRVSVLITHARLGTVSASLNLFDTEGLPDLIIGTDIMRAWSDRWYFSFEPRGGSVTVVPRDGGATSWPTHTTVSAQKTPSAPPDPVPPT
jgi:hypothetical protein